MTGVQTCALPICFPVTIVLAEVASDPADEDRLDALDEVELAEPDSDEALEAKLEAADVTFETCVVRSPICVVSPEMSEARSK